MSNSTIHEQFNANRYEGARVRLELLQPEHADALYKFKLANRAFLQPFAPLQTDDQFTMEAQRLTIHYADLEASTDQAYRFGVVHKRTGEFLGQLNLTGIIRGAFHNALLGYSMDQTHNGKGLMTEAVKISLAIAFGELKLHRVQAAVMPRNIGSVKVLRNNGFAEEGYARRYLRINGNWEDHLLFACLNEQWEIQPE